MRFTKIVLVFALFMSISGTAYCGTATTGYTGYSWALDSNVYTFNFWINGIPGPTTDKIIAWEFAPSNLASPGTWTTTDTYWKWDSSKWVLAVDAKEKYNYGAALMPGEVLTFKYTLNNGVTPLADDPTFIAHVARTPGLSASGTKWLDVGNTWFDNSKKEPKPPYNLVPEPGSLLALSSAIFSLGCLKFKRARV